MIQLKKLLILIIAGVLSFSSLYAGASDYWTGKGRIALSSDGNMHDNDDMQATMMSLMILAKARLQPNTVLYTYADHVWGSENNDLEIMRESAEGGGQRFGFQDTRFIPAVTNPEAAYNAMRDEILASTADNPLFIIAAGPMHVVGTGLDRANNTDPDALNHVTVISHSRWNNRHSDNPETGSVHGTEPTHSGWAWDEMNAAFGDKVNFNKISDQNGTGDQPYKTKDKFSAPSWDDWSWMGDHQDPNVNWVYTKGMSNPGGPDYSDAGMVYYFCADLNGIRGDEFGNPEKLEQWIGSETIPVEIDPERVSTVNVTPTSFTIEEVGGTKQLTAVVYPETAVNKSVTWESDSESIATVDDNGLVRGIAKGNAKITVTTEDGGKIATCQIKVGTVVAGETTVGDDFIAIEADATHSPLGQWVVRKPGSEGYDAIQGDIAPINNTYIEYTGGTVSGLGVSPGTDALVYKFTPKTSGKYRLTGRMAQRLTDNGTKAAWDQCNDIYIKLEGDYQSGNNTPLNILKNWNKFYGRGKDQWGAFVQGDVNHSKYQMVYDLKAGVEYTFSISGRSKRCCIDYFVFSKTSLTIAEDTDLATANDPKYRPGNYACNEFFSVDFDKYTNMGQGFADATIDANRDVLQMPVRLAWGAAEVTYDGPDAEVYVTLNTMQETDGESTYRVFIGGEKIAEVTNDNIFGTEISDYTIQKHELTDTRISVKKGDVIRVEFNSATNGEVPEGNTTATSRGRWKSINLCSDKGASETEEEKEPEIISHTAPADVYMNATETAFKVNYNSDMKVDFAVAVHCTSTNNSTEGFKRMNGILPAQNGEINITVPFNSQLDPAKDYRWVLYFLPEGGTWENQYTPLNIPFVVSETVGIKDLKSSLRIYPTVFRHKLSIEARERIQAIRMIGLNGSVVLSKGVNCEKTTLNTNVVPAGIYCLKITFETGGMVVKKVIKE